MDTKLTDLPQLEDDGDLWSIYKPPEKSGWRCYLLGKDDYGIVLRPSKGLVPNWFHRKMQEFCFGVKWEKELDN